MNQNRGNMEMPESFRFETDIPLAELTSFRVGGPARFVLRPQSYEEIRQVMEYAASVEMPVTLLGKGTNILAADSGFDGLVIRFDTPLHEPVFDGTKVIACCGTSLTQLSRETVKRGLSGMERLCGIPGTVGGACAMNAGAYGGEIKQILKRIRVLRNGRDEWIDVKDEDLGYRRSAYTFPGTVALEAEFELAQDDGTAAETMQSCMEKRRAKQPLELPSAGSTFKRPEGYFAGALIEQCGLKGYSVGGAQVSPKHAGFIVNTGGATENDITALIEHVRAVVKERTGVTLEPEVKRI
ncbi:MAG: UDP-N-acetylmuramate dehydrogenase [Clostridia bacterium]|nr:UDP-N-acetylmuramate dehydrogenase [Clostridia bacterium]